MANPRTKKQAQQWIEDAERQATQAVKSAAFLAKKMDGQHNVASEVRRAQVHRDNAARWRELLPTLPD